MPYLIDGNNLIGHIPDLSLGDRESRFLLVSRLRRFQKIKNTRVILVFDGPPQEGLGTYHNSVSPFSIAHPEPGESADSLIEEFIREQTDLRRFFVVSSDREIRYFARKHGAKSIDCAAFYLELKGILRESREEAELQKNDEPPTPLEVRQWDDVFRTKK
jgi:predicted RNA-binding protein with PIN domain